MVVPDPHAYGARTIDRHPTGPMIELLTSNVAVRASTLSTLGRLADRTAAAAGTARPGGGAAAWAAAPPGQKSLKIFEKA